ncbi:MAG: carbohydrate ABC transporter substrate-binding protein [Gammaproteobacteria bacterium]|nr:MAG: carbohydrate ABC transporter substrate-binding protein [Gammaproteobacteria bacterium]
MAVQGGRADEHSTLQAWVTAFQPSTLTPTQQQDELSWFVQAAKPYRGMTIRVVSERIDTHKYEASVLARAFHELTGIHVVHELTGEDDVIKKLQTQIQTGLNLYDAYINDSDFIGYHFRSGHTVPINTLIHDEAITLPTLDLNDFIGLAFTTGPDGKIYQLPDQQFANLYWYRHDWFSRPELRAWFKRLYGYELGVPQNWAAYRDIAEFFTDHVKEIDGQRVWGHMDYARTDPSLGWRMSDAWLSMAGAGDPGLPNGLPVDDWGIRVIGCQPVGASVARGGALDSPAAVYAVETFIDWLDRYAPPEARDLNFTQAGEWVGKGQIAQQVFWYTAFTAAMTKPGLPVVNEDGTPKWRMAPSPHGKYWQKGMKLGYQDAGSWTFLRETPEKRRKAAWLYAQFTVSKTVSLKKTLVGLTPIRKSDIESDVMTRRAPYLGGLVEFYRSKGRDVWTPTGVNVPDYGRLAGYWWQHISRAVEGRISVKAAMQELAGAVDKELGLMSREGELSCAPVLNAREPDEYWLNRAGAPKPVRAAPEKGETLPYEEAIKAWR